MSYLTRSTLLLATAVFACSAIAVHAQARKSAYVAPDSRVDIYGGISYLAPVNSGINNYAYQPVNNGNATLSVSGFFSHYLGVQAEGSYFSGNTEHAAFDLQHGLTCYHESCNQIIYTAEAGPVARWPLGSFVPFAHLLGGGARLNGPVNQPLHWGWGTTGGAGVDYVLPYLNHHLALRLVQADFFFSDVNNGPLVQPLGLSGGVGKLTAYKISAGLVVRLGTPSTRPQLQLGCSVAPVNGFPGDPLQINGTTLGTDPNRKQLYTWTTNGGKITGSGLAPGIDTTGIAPGEYVIKGHLAEGPHADQQADCDAPFNVRGYEPPTIACSATPNVAVAGTLIAISTSGGSPQNRPLTYSYSSTEGEITSSGPTARLTTVGLRPALITITCNVVDDLGQSAKTTTTVTLNEPPTPVVSATQPLCSLSFGRDTRRPERVDNEASACLDDIALTLNQQTNAHLVIVGNYEAPETDTAGAARAINTRLYLTEQKGIDPSRIELRVGDGTGKSATNTLVPPGAVFNEAGTHRFNEGSVPKKGQPYGRGAEAARPKAGRKLSAAPSTP